MAIDFNGTTSKIQHNTADLGVTNLVTVCAWVFARGMGELNFGVILVLDEAHNSFLLRHHDAANTLELVTILPGTDGRWTFPATDNQWNAVAIRYDGSSTANNPEARVGFANVTVTEIAAPSAAMVTPNTGYCIGNRSGQDRTWDGMLAHIQGFNRILTDGEMDQACRRPGSVRSGLFMPMYHAGYLTDLSGNAFNGTGTDLTDAVGGPPTSPLYSRGSYSPYAIAAAAGARHAQLTLLGVGV